MLSALETAIAMQESAQAAIMREQQQPGSSFPIGSYSVPSYSMASGIQQGDWLRVGDPVSLASRLPAVARAFAAEAHASQQQPLPSRAATTAGLSPRSMYGSAAERASSPTRPAYAAAASSFSSSPCAAVAAAAAAQPQGTHHNSYNFFVPGAAPPLLPDAASWPAGVLSLVGS